MIEWRPWRRVGNARRGGLVVVADHASNFVPADIDLGITSDLLDKHVALDIGVEGTAERMARRHGIPAHIATISRLVCDLHREEDHPAVVPVTSDGHLIPGNIGVDLDARLDRFHRPYHAALETWLEDIEPELIVSLHSFTPALESDPSSARPWEVALLYNEDEEPARYAIRLLGEQGLRVGDNEPYSGKTLNATMNRHAEARGRRYIAIEVRQDQIVSEAGQARWASMLADVAGRVALMLNGG